MISEEDVEILGKKFNWGAFLLTPIWGIFNKTYIALLAFIIPFIPIIGLLSIPFSIYFGVNGNKLALKNRKWDTVEQFNKTQKVLAVIGIIVSSFILARFLNFEYRLYNYEKIVKIRKEVSVLMQDSMLKINSNGDTCGSTSAELASCFSKYVSTNRKDENILVTNKYGTWKFYGTDLSKEGYNFIEIDINSKNNPNRYGLDIIKVPLKTDNKGKFLIEDNTKGIPNVIFMVTKDSY